MNKVEITAERCKACDLCVRACPKKILARGSEINAGGHRYVVCTDQSQCIACASCAWNCPDSAIDVWKEN